MSVSGTWFKMAKMVTGETTVPPVVVVVVVVDDAIRATMARPCCFPPDPMLAQCK